MSLCLDHGVVPGCHKAADGTLTPVFVHFKAGASETTPGNLAVGTPVFTDAAGAVLALDPAEVTAGACPVPLPDIEFEKLCDVDADGKLIQEFICRTLTTFAADGTPTTTAADFELDKVTPYAVQGTATACTKECDPIAAADTAFEL